MSRTRRSRCASSIGLTAAKLTTLSILQAIHRVKAYSVQTACDALFALIRSRLLPRLTSGEEPIEADCEHLEKACVTFVLFSFEGAKAGSSPVQKLTDLLDLIAHEKSGILSAKAVHAMQTLIWKTSESGGALQVDGWLQLLRHAAFEAAGQTNKSIIGRYACDIT